MNNSLYVPIHSHSELSLLDGMGLIKDWVVSAKEKGFRAISITDHGNVDGAIKFIEECEKQSIIPIVGVEAYIVPNMTIKNKGEKRGHICLFVKNERGWTNLLQMLTVANLTGFYRKPRIDYKLLLEHSEGLIISTACVSSFLNLEGGIELFYRLIDKKKNEDLYLEVMPHCSDSQIRINNLCLELSQKTEIPIVASNDSHYIRKEDAKTHEVLLAIQRGAKWEDPNRWKFDPKYEIWLKSADEMLETFKRQGILTEEEAKSALRKTLLIAKNCGDFRIPKKGISLPKPPNLEVENENEYFRNLCLEGMKKRFGKWPSKEYENRFEYEYKIITEKQFSRYFLIVRDTLNYCKRNDIMYGPGRGSVGCSLIAFLIEITNVDPIKYELPFARFINEERIDFPDIDLDFEDIKRDQIKEYCKEKYGEFNVAAISTFLRMKSRMVVRDVGRVFNVDLKAVDKFSKSIRESIDDGLETEEGKTFQKLYPEVIYHSKNLEGQCRGNSSHAAGLIIAENDLRNGKRCYLANRKDTITVNWDGTDCEKVNLIKFDFLGLNALTVLNEAKRLLKLKGIDLIYENIPLDDSAIYDDVSNGLCAGIFQMGYAVINLTKELRIKNFMEWSDVIALARPGPLDSGMAELYVKRRSGEKWKPKHPIYEEVTKKTYGICAYQEDIMNVIHKVAGLPYPIADKIRKIIGKKRDASEFEQFKETFINGCLKQKTLSRSEAEEFWRELQHHASYSFNRAHSVEYAMLGYWSAWIKHYYPGEFICATLTYGGDTHKQELITEASRLGLQICPPRIGKSDAIRWITEENKLYIPFLEIKGIGPKAANKLSENLSCKPKTEKKKNRGFLICEETPKDYSFITGKIRELLNQVGAFSSNDDFPVNSEELFDFKIVKDIKKAYPNLFSLLGKSFPERRISDALEGNLKGLSLFVKKNIPYKIGSRLGKCYNCELRLECPKPVYPSISRNNTMIVGEAPFKDESKQGKPFVGKVSKILWNTLDKFELQRNDFYITNAVKCPPLKSKNPNAEHVLACRSWLEEEIENVRPFIILSLGQWARYSLVGEEKGILKANGTIVWSEEFQCWIVFAVHPGYVNRNKSYIGEFENALKLFSDKISELGGV